MRAIPFWQGVRMRRVEIGPDPDAAPRRVTIPASWDDAAAAALAGIAPGDGPADLRAAADRWIRLIEERARSAGLARDLTEQLHRLLLERRGAPAPGIWRSEPADVPAFVLNLPAFCEAGLGFDVAAFASAVELAAIALTVFNPSARRIAVAMADLDGLLSALGLDYDSAGARQVASALAALLRGTADAASAAMAGVFGGTAPASAPGLPIALPTVVAGLTEAAEKALAAASGAALHHIATTAIAEAGQAEALLGVETGGIAPAFAMARAEGGLTRAARARLAARGLSGEAALAALLSGADPLPLAGVAAHAAMHDAVALYIQAMPERPALVATPAWRPVLPARRERGHGARDQAPLLPLELPRIARLRSRGRASTARGSQPANLRA